MKNLAQFGSILFAIGNTRVGMTSFQFLSLIGPFPDSFGPIGRYNYSKSWSHKVNITSKFKVPPVLHNKCDVKLLDISVSCKMQGDILECALSDCDGEKFKCDCNVYEYVPVIIDSWLTV